ncbi:MAG: hypothetical protein IPK85_02065 [Gemmatimonadetes bacterium]|nr:hypothetical protein [Gemmatimonadota bacterium]
MTIILAVLAAVLGLVWGLFWAHVRDQGRLPGAPSFTKAKEVGIAMFGLPAAVFGFVAYGWVEAGLIWAGMSGAWSLGHMGGLGLRFYESRKGLSVPMAYLAMAGTGALVTLAPAGVLAWHEAWIAAAAVLLAGVAKVATYEAGFIARGLTDREPHATWLGALGHGAILYTVTAAAMVLA